MRLHVIAAALVLALGAVGHVRTVAATTPAPTTPVPTNAPTMHPTTPYVESVETSGPSHCPPDFPTCDPYSTTVPMTATFGNSSFDIIMYAYTSVAGSCRHILEQGGAMALKRVIQSFLLAEMSTATVGRLRLQDISIFCPNSNHTQDGKMAIFISDQGLWYDKYMYSEAALNPIYNETAVNATVLPAIVAETLTQHLHLRRIYYNTHQLTVDFFDWTTPYVPPQPSAKEEDVIAATFDVAYLWLAAVSAVVFIIWKVRGGMKQKIV